MRDLHFASVSVLLRRENALSVPALVPVPVQVSVQDTFF
jgi:hypothetical protein